MAEEVIIMLENQHTHEPHPFSFEHAVRLLTQQQKTRFDCWNLPQDSQYIFQHGNIITRPGTRKAKHARQPEEAQEGDTTRGTDADAHGADNGEG